MKKGLRKSYRIQKGPLPSIDQRPEEATTRTVVGHWEDDSIVYTPTCPIRLRTTNDLTSGIVFIARTKDSTMFDANRITHHRLGGLPPDLRKTLTRDLPFPVCSLNFRTLGRIVTKVLLCFEGSVTPSRRDGEPGA